MTASGIEFPAGRRSSTKPQRSRTSSPLSDPEPSPAETADYPGVGPPAGPRWHRDVYLFGSYTLRGWAYARVGPSCARFKGAVLGAGDPLLPDGSSRQNHKIASK